jgi:hypothetical protein
MSMVKMAAACSSYIYHDIQIMHDRDNVEMVVMVVVAAFFHMCLRSYHGYYPIRLYFNLHVAFKACAGKT